MSRLYDPEERPRGESKAMPLTDVRVALACCGQNAFVVAWVPTYVLCPGADARLAAMAGDISRHVGLMPVVLMARNYAGDVLTFGDGELTRALLGVEPEALRWVELFEAKAA